MPEDDIYEPEPDDDDTGPLHISTSSAPVDDDWDVPAQGSWAGRFDAPLSVSPRPVQSPRNTKVWLGAVGAVVAVAAIGGVVFWLVRTSSDTPEASAGEPATPAAPATSSPNDDEERLLRLLPPGYPSDACDPVAAPKQALAQVDCGKNNDPGGPLSATYTLARDKAALDAAFTETIQSANRVNCPGNIQSPGPWRRNAAPDKVAGTLFCGLRAGRPTVAWTDDTNLVLSAVESGPGGPAFPQLYAWWSSHS